MYRYIRISGTAMAGRGARSKVGAGVPRSSQRYLGFRAHFSMICHKGKR